MAQAANIFDAASLRRPQLAVAAVPRVALGTSASARLIPGAGNLISDAAKKNARAAMRDGSWVSVPKALTALAAKLAVQSLPEFFRQFHPALLGTALLDVTLLSLVFLSELQSLPPD